MQNKVVLIIAMLFFATQSYAATGSNSILVGLSTSSLGLPACTLIGDDAWNYDDLQGTGTNPNFAFLNQGTNATPFGSSAVCDSLKTAGVPECPTIEDGIGINGTGSIAFFFDGYQRGLWMNDDSRADFRTSNKFSVTFHAQSTNTWASSIWVWFSAGNILTKSHTYLPDEYMIGGVSGGSTVNMCIDVTGVTDGGACGTGSGKTTDDWGLGNEWHHFAFVWEGDPTPPHTAAIGTYTVYQDGVVVGSDTGITGRITNSTGVVRTGDTYGAYARMLVRLDNMNVFYNKALTPAEVLETNCNVLTTR